MEEMLLRCGPSRDAKMLFSGPVRLPAPMA